MRGQDVTIGVGRWVSCRNLNATKAHMRRHAVFRQETMHVIPVADPHAEPSATRRPSQNAAKAIHRLGDLEILARNQQGAPPSSSIAEASSVTASPRTGAARSANPALIGKRLRSLCQPEPAPILGTVRREGIGKSLDRFTVSATGRASRPPSA